MKKVNQGDIPSFSSEDEEAEFWATHELGDDLLHRMERKGVSKHFTKQAAHRSASAQELDEQNRGKSSGWARIHFGVRRRKGLVLRRWETFRKEAK